MSYIFIQNSEKVGQLLEEVGIDFSEIKDQMIQTRWYQSLKAETDVFVWMDKNSVVIKQQVNFMGTVAEWNRIDGIKTGIFLEVELAPASENSSSPANEMPLSQTVRFDFHIDQTHLTKACEIIRYSKCIPESIKSQLIENFTIKNKEFNFFEKWIRWFFD